MSVDRELMELSRRISDLQQIVSRMAPEIPIVRPRLAADLTLYVRSDGSDSNSGLADTAAGAFLTIQKAVDVACSYYDPALYNITIQVQAGTWSLSSKLVLKRHFGMNAVVLKGDTTTPGNCILQSDDAYVVHGLQEWSPWKIEGFTLRRTSGSTNNFLFVSERGNTVMGRMALGACGTGAQILVSSSSYLSMESATIDVLTGAGSSALLRSADHSIIRINNAVFNLPGVSTAFTNFVLAQSHGSIYAGGNTFNNAANITGNRWAAVDDGHVRCGGSLTYFPGTVNGAGTNGGIYS